LLTYVATVVEAAVDEEGHLTMPRVDTAIDCGFAANPERICSQIEGATVMGMSLALYGENLFSQTNHTDMTYGLSVAPTTRPCECPRQLEQNRASNLHFLSPKLGDHCTDSGC
jgi:CO/xanthine dehydrogenase Mo-binding subunit